MKHSKKIVIVVVALLIISLIGGISYALWGRTDIQEDPNVLAAGCFELTFEGENDIKLINTFPKSDDAGMLTGPYKFSIRNVCTVAIEYDVNLEVLAKSTLDSSYVKVALDRYSPEIVSDKASRDVTVGKESFNLISGYLAPASEEGGTDGGVVNYDLRLWVDESAEAETMEQSFYSKVVVTAVNTPTRGVLASSGDISLRQDGSLHYYYYIDETTGTSSLDVRGIGETQEESIISNIIDDIAFKNFSEERWEELKNLGDGLVYNFIVSYGFVPNEYFANEECDGDGLCITSRSSILDYFLEEGVITQSDYDDYEMVLDVLKPIDIIEIYSGVTEIGDEVFRNLFAKELVIPHSVKTIGYKAFQYNYFNELIIPRTVSVIDDLAFSFCDLEKVEFSDGLKSIGRSAFWSNNLTELTIPSTVTTINQQAFLENPLTKVTLESKSIYIYFQSFCIDFDTRVPVYIPSDANVSWSYDDPTSACAVVNRY